MNNCQDCAYFRQTNVGWSYEEYPGGQRVEQSANIGRCRRRAPTASGATDVTPAVWPLVRITDWCGEFEHKSTQMERE